MPIQSELRWINLDNLKNGKPNRKTNKLTNKSLPAIRPAPKKKTHTRTPRSDDVESAESIDTA